MFRKITNPNGLKRISSCVLSTAGIWDSHSQHRGITMAEVGGQRFDAVWSESRTQSMDSGHHFRTTGVGMCGNCSGSLTLLKLQQAGKLWTVYIPCHRNRFSHCNVGESDNEASPESLLHGHSVTEADIVWHCGKAILTISVEIFGQEYRWDGDIALNSIWNNSLSWLTTLPLCPLSPSGISPRQLAISWSDQLTLTSP